MDTWDSWDNCQSLRALHDEWQRNCQRQDREGRIKYRLASTAFDEAKARTIDAFAAERGWIRGKHFSLSQLKAARHCAGNTDVIFPHDIGHLAFDHPYFFRQRNRPYRPAGIVVHVYAEDYSEAMKVADEQALLFEPLAWSWYYPGRCLAGVYRRIEVAALWVARPKPTHISGRLDS